MVRRLVHDEQGIALVLALMTMITLSILTGAAAVIVSVNQRESLHSSDARRAFGIAEACLAYSEGDIYGADAAHDSSSIIPDQRQPCDADGGKGWYWTTVAGDGVTWTMHGEGTYGSITRDVSAQANVPGPVTIQDTGVWNYLYADKVTTDGSCPTTIGGNTTVAVPTYVRGNLCLQSKFTGSQLGVGGNLILTGSKAQVGSATTPVQKLAVTGACDGVTTGTGVCSGTKSPIYASSVSSSLGITPGLPALDLTGTYNDVNPGPADGHGCPVSSGEPANFFDNDTVLNDSDGTIDLFPSSPYDCVNGSNEIKWDPNVDSTCKTGDCLTVNGTFYFDGNLDLAGNEHVIYNGIATIYVTGTINTSGNFALCAVSSCNSSWDTSLDALDLIAACWANSDGSQLVSLATTGNYCVDYGGTNTMQAGTYCATDYYISGSADNWGPVLADTLTLNGDLSELVPFTVMPPGTPTNTATSYLPASAPTYWSG